MSVTHCDLVDSGRSNELSVVGDSLDSGTYKGLQGFAVVTCRPQATGGSEIVNRQ